jgi:ABC-type nitrate/sulfonate/bicarbonate transport system ATPase subunit
MSRQPGRIVAEVPVDLPSPRVPQLRSTSEYSRIVGEVVKLLGET